MIVRFAQPHDASAIEEINIDAFSYSASAEKIAAFIAKNSPLHILLVACEGDQVLGCVHCLKLDTILREESWEVYSLAVRSGYRDRGIGGMLLDGVEKIALERGAEVIELNSGVERLDAHRFYKKHGYLERKEVKHFIKPFAKENAE